MPSGPILALVGLRREAEIAARAGWHPLIGAGRPDGLERAARDFLTRQPCAGILSFGLGGGLHGGLAPGRLVLGRTVVTPTKRHVCDRDWVAALAARLPAAHPGDVAGQPRIAASVTDKQDLRLRTGADLVDTESHLAARLAAEHDLPLAVLRAVCDPSDAALPPAALVPLDARGAPRLGLILASLAGHPLQLPALIGLAGDSARAFASLEKAATILFA